ncbi:hypothetical protein BKA65DRAFT_474781 [Rhexocercosporidium sp. MPI-PUGE-AT-0058]|nr:hypothetical protein BKA65DRAFT_474781 [Rhexocercosporidium sp. MPI-PUGE-AT-0058]
MPSQKERKKLFRADREAAAQRTASGTGNNQGTMNMDVDEQSRPSTAETLINSSATEQPRPSTAKTPSTSSSDHLMGTSSDPQSHDVPRFASSQRAASKTKPTPSASLTSTPAKQVAPPKAPLGPSPSLAAKSSAPKSTFQKVTAPKPTMSNEQGGAFVRQFGPPKLSATSTQPPASQPDKLVNAPAPKPIGSQGLGNLFDNQGVKIPQTTSTNVAPNYTRAAQEKRNLNQFMVDIPETYKGSTATGSYQSKQHMGKADARKTAENNARERAELEKFADSFWDGKPKGADHPRGKFHAEWNRPRHPALVVVKTIDPEKPFWVSSDYQVGYNVVYGLNSQFPDLHFTEKALKSQLPDLSAKRQKRDDGLKSDAAPIDPMTETFKIIAASVNSFENPDDPDGPNEVIFDGTILGANPELDAITDLFGKIRMSGMSHTVARKVRDFIYVKPGGNTKVGLKVYTLSLNDKNDHLYSGSSKLSALLKANISKKPVIAVIRNYYLVFPAVDRFWKGIMTEAVTYGTFPHYNSSGAPSWWPNKVKAINSSAEPSKATDPLKRETWMKDNTGKYHSHDKVVRFDTNKQFRDLLSATLYTDTVAKVESVQTLCNDATFHPATVTYVNPEGMVVLDVSSATISWANHGFWCCFSARFSDILDPGAGKPPPIGQI